MRQYIIRRLLLAIITVVIVAFISFILLRLTPGDAIMAKVAAGGIVSPDRIAQLRKEMGLDAPIPVQFLHWVSGIAHGDFGLSFNTDKPTIVEFANALPVTLELGIIALVSSVIVALPIGIISALKRDTVSDYLGRTIAILGISLPTFWIGILLIVYPSIWFRWEWPRGSPSLIGDPVTNLKAFLVPGIVLGFASSAGMMRFLRTSVLNVLGQDYARTAHAKGLGERTVVLRHVLRNSLLPVVTLIGAQLGYLVGGSVIIEELFGLPGVGFQTLNAVNQRDYPQLQTNLLILGLAIVLANLITDICYGWIDPRISYS